MTLLEIEEEGHRSQKWEENYFCSQIQSIIVYLILLKTIDACKDYTIKHHYKTKQQEKIWYVYILW